MFDIFEQPWTLLGISVIVFFVVLTIRSVFPEKQHWWQWAIPAAIAVAAFGLDFLVTTNLEKIHSLIKTAIKAVEQEDCLAIENIIADDYRDSRHRSKEALMAHCRAELTPPCVEENRKLAVLVELSPPEATATLSLLIKFDRDSRVTREYKRYALIKTKLYLQKQPNKKWLINQVEILEIDKMPFSWEEAG
jgi:hypothetical protein